MAPPTPRVNTLVRTVAPWARATAAVRSSEPSSITKICASGTLAATSFTTRPTDSSSLSAGITTSTARRSPFSLTGSPVPDQRWLVPGVGTSLGRLSQLWGARIAAKDVAQAVDGHRGQDGQDHLEGRPVPGLAERNGHREHHGHRDRHQRDHRHPSTEQPAQPGQRQPEQAVIGPQADQGPVIGASLDERVEVDLLEWTEEGEAA